jgi:transcription initiation factor TFIID subunit 12
VSSASQPQHAALKQMNGAPIVLGAHTTNKDTVNAPISPIADPGVVPWHSTTQGRPTLTGGMAAGRMFSMYFTLY